MKKYGLIGSSLSHSFSKKYFTKKFKKEKLDQCIYSNFEIENCRDLKSLVKKNKLTGLNITFPFKEQIIPFLDKTSKQVKIIGAVNTIKSTDNFEKITGHNTDIIGFEKSILPLLKRCHNKALVIGSGGSSKAVKFVLNKYKIKYKTISRRASTNSLCYSKVSSEMVSLHKLIINCTPLGIGKHINIKPNLPYNAISKKHLIYDLNYNPSKTLFLLQAEKQGAMIKNGKEMLKIQAEKSWKIWNT